MFNSLSNSCTFCLSVWISCCAWRRLSFVLSVSLVVCELLRSDGRSLENAEVDLLLLLLVLSDVGGGEGEDDVCCADF